MFSLQCESFWMTSTDLSFNSEVAALIPDCTFALNCRACIFIRTAKKILKHGWQWLASDFDGIFIVSLCHLITYTRRVILLIMSNKIFYIMKIVEKSCNINMKFAPVILPTNLLFLSKTITYKNLSIKWSSFSTEKKIVPMKEKLYQTNFTIPSHCQPLMNMHEPFLQK